MNKQLTKSAHNKQISGVAAGLAEYFDVDVSLVRIAFVVFTIMGGPGLLLYIILALVLPEEGAVYYDEKDKNDFVS